MIHTITCDTQPEDMSVFHPKNKSWQDSTLRGGMGGLRETEWPKQGKDAKRGLTLLGINSVEKLWKCKV